ncbi:composite domain of metallo-dependent hydrolase [Epithele typhae]|uniref:composite domain of metallo-dependent hydrolase n=1 Tax=Epithele typhae TaxID=378194 RepID=UPI002008E916|nr:composite domain of metallo-dependent hydrolase [Epithele typhae]KAH9943156.1 composite domain of metallo-dependent hydrolase [Epithele typhae]
MTGREKPPQPPTGPVSQCRGPFIPHDAEKSHQRRFSTISRKRVIGAAVVAASVCAFTIIPPLPPATTAGFRSHPSLSPEEHVLCSRRFALPRAREDALLRSKSDRFEPGTRPTLIKNITLWTGARNGTEIVYGDIFLDKGLVQGIGYIPEILYVDRDTDVVDAHGGWITPGLVDLHSHIGVTSAPLTAASLQMDSPSGPILPWLRSIDGLSTHDASYPYAVAGGVTTVQVLPDYGRDAIGGQAFMIKLRKTSQRTPTSMLIEAPYQLNGTDFDPYEPRWRHLVMSCGERTRASGNRMDTMWALRAAFAMARGFRDAQDAPAWGGRRGQQPRYPEDYRWEALVDVLRGRVKVSVVCDEAVDLDGLVRFSQEFKVPIASIHGAHEAYLMPDALKTIPGVVPPTVVLSADSSRQRRETFRGSEFSPWILAEHGIPVAMKTDALNSYPRDLIFEAQQAHHYGLPPNLALASVTSVPATAAGLVHRIGIIREGADADLVLWDSHPLQLGASPRKVWIDGILQVHVDAVRARIPVPKAKNTTARRRGPPPVPDFATQKDRAVRFDGIPPLRPNRTVRGRVAFRNVREVFLRDRGDGAGPLTFGLDGGLDEDDDNFVDVIVDRGRVACFGRYCDGDRAEVEFDLRGGAVAPALMAFGSGLGLEELESEPSTGDGARFDPFRGNVPDIVGDAAGLTRVSDALQFGTRNALVAHHAGVTYATTSFLKPHFFSRGSFVGGLSATFRTGATNGLQRAAIIKPITALHIAIGRHSPLSSGIGVSTEIATLRHLLLGGEDEHTETGKWFQKAASGEIPLVIDVASADAMVSIIRMKNEIEEKRGSYMNMVFSRATEAHMVADELVHAKIGVILMPSRAFPWTWDERRNLPGPPLTNSTTLNELLKKRVKVGIGLGDMTHSQSMRFELGWAALDSDGLVDKKRAYELMSINLEKILDLEGWVGDVGELVAYEGGSGLDFTSRPVAIVAPSRGLVEVL